MGRTLNRKMRMTMPHKYDCDPDDHGAYMVRCSRCGARYHLSEVHDCSGEPDGDYDPLDERWGDNVEADDAAESYFEGLERRRERGRE